MSIGEWLISKSSYAFHPNSLKSVAVIPNIILALTFQANFFPIYKGMRAVNDEKFRNATLFALIICASLCMFIGVYTYLLYGDDLQANFLLCLDYKTVDPTLYYGMNISFTIFIIFAFPVSFISARDNFIKVIKLIRSYCTQKNIIES
jgi:amino acid permease